MINRNLSGTYFTGVCNALALTHLLSIALASLFDTNMFLPSVLTIGWQM
jgi:hypothetical protein